MVCSLCGSKKHNLRTCTLPGAAQHRSMHRELLKLKGAVPNAQAGRKPRRLGAPTTGRFQAQRSLRYSGSGRAKLRKAVANKKRAKTVGLTQTSDGQLQAVKDLRLLAYSQTSSVSISLTFFGFLAVGFCPACFASSTGETASCQQSL